MGRRTLFQQTMEARPVATGRSATLSVAARESSEGWREQADFRCEDYASDEQAVQAAIAALPSWGGEVHLSEAPFALQAPIEITPSTPPLLLSGCGRQATIVTAPAGMGDYFIKVQGTGITAETQVRFPEIRDLWLQGHATLGSKNVNDALLLEYAAGVTLQNIYISGFQGHAIRMNTVWNTDLYRVEMPYCGHAAGVKPTVRIGTASNNIRFWGCDIIAPEYFGLYVAGATPNFSRKIYWFGGKAHGIIGAPAAYSQMWWDDVIDCAICDCNLTNAAKEHILVSGTAKGVRILGNNLDNAGQTSQAAIRFIESAAGRIADNSFGEYVANQSGDVDVSATSGHVEIGENVGYISRNGGAAASVGDGGTIAHGLAHSNGTKITPSRVEVTPSVPGEMASVTAIGDTTFTVAIKKHDGSAGTSQTIYWRAHV